MYYKVDDKVIVIATKREQTIAEVMTISFGEKVYKLKEDGKKQVYYSHELKPSLQVITPFEYFCDYLKIRQGEIFDICDPSRPDDILYSMTLGKKDIVFLDDDHTDENSILVQLMKGELIAIPSKIIQLGDRKMRVSQKIYNELWDVINEYDDVWVDDIK